MTAIINFAEGAAPSTPAAGTHTIYFSEDGALHTLSDAGVDATLATTAIELVTANVADEAITNAKLAHMAESTIKGRAAAAGTGDATDLSVAQVATLLEGQFTPYGDAAWTTVTLATGYSMTPADLYPASHTYAEPAYRKIGGVVYLRGAARCTTAGYFTLATLPAGYRPANDAMFVGHSATTTGTNAETMIWIYTDGQIVTTGGNIATFHLDGICFVPA